jgi:hypothetical protein
MVCDFKRGDFVVETESGRVAAVEEMNDEWMVVRWNRKDDDGNDQFDEVAAEDFKRFK